MVYEALSKMSVDKTKWMAIYIDISPQCIRLVDKDVSGVCVLCVVVCRSTNNLDDPPPRRPVDYPLLNIELGLSAF